MQEFDNFQHPRVKKVEKEKMQFEGWGEWVECSIMSDATICITYITGKIKELLNISNIWNMD